MKNKLLSLCIILTSVVSAQGINLLNVKSPSEFAKKQQAIADSLENDPGSKPLEYGVVEDKDIMWSKVVWEVVDMKPLLNQPYYNSSKGIAGIAQKSLFDAVKEGLDNGKIKEAYGDDTFSSPIDYKQVWDRLKVKDTTDYGREQMAETGQLDPSSVIDCVMKNTDVKMFKVMGMWYVDKKLGEMRYRPLGIAFMGPDMRAIKEGFDDGTYFDLFWIWYADARDVLSKTKVFNGKNNTANISFDDMINARRFNSVIYKEQNADGISIEEKLPSDAEGQLKYGDKIKNGILNTENTLWNQ